MSLYNGRHFSWNGIHLKLCQFYFKTNIRSFLCFYIFSKKTWSGVRKSEKWQNSLNNNIKKTVGFIQLQTDSKYIKSCSQYQGTYDCIKKWWNHLDKIQSSFLLNIRESLGVNGTFFNLLNHIYLNPRI